MEIYVSCKDNKYDLYNELNKYFEVEFLEGDENTMGIGDLKILIEPITKSIETLGNIIVAIINTKRTSITIRNGDKEFTFEGNISALDSAPVKDAIKEIIEV